MHTLDPIIAKHTGFESLADMLNAKGGYRPSLFCKARNRDDLELCAINTAIADAYDQAQTERDDDRRAYRY